jgi:hypothetical protein
VWSHGQMMTVKNATSVGERVYPGGSAQTYTRLGKQQASRILDW